jgi:mannose-6-phosphate isomerase-like protein (cupin superfamily)
MIEEYCLGILPEKEANEMELMIDELPELRTAMEEFRQKLDNRNMPALQVRIWSEIRQKMNSIPVSETSANTGILSRSTKLSELKVEIGDLTIPENDANITMVPFRKVLGFEQFLVRVRHFVIEETHEDLLESFFILEGTCICFLGERQIPLEAGGFVEIPMFIPHSVTITSDKPVLAILQRGTIY